MSILIKDKNGNKVFIDESDILSIESDEYHNHTIIRLKECKIIREKKYNIGSVFKSDDSYYVVSQIDTNILTLISCYNGNRKNDVKINCFTSIINDEVITKLFKQCKYEYIGELSNFFKEPE